jgi:hypothetical protein
VLCVCCVDVSADRCVHASADGCRQSLPVLPFFRRYPHGYTLCLQALQTVIFNRACAVAPSQTLMTKAPNFCCHTQLLCSCPCRLSTSGCPSQQVLKSVATHIAVLVSSQAEYKWECVSANSGACSLLENDDYQTSVVRELKSSDFIGAEIRAGTKLMFKLYARFQNSTQESSVTEVWAAFSSVCARLRHEYMFAGAHTHARTLTHNLLLL